MSKGIGRTHGDKGKCRCGRTIIQTFGRKKKNRGGKEREFSHLVETEKDLTSPETKREAGVLAGICWGLKRRRKNKTKKPLAGAKRTGGGRGWPVTSAGVKSVRAGSRVGKCGET